MNHQQEYARWSAAYAGNEYFYGHDAGPVARRALRYHRPLCRGASTPAALDVGCGEGQDVAFLAAHDYNVTGLDFIPAALQKAQRLLELQNLQADLISTDLAAWEWSRERFDLVLAVNSLQFLGEDATPVLRSVIDSVAPGGVLGLSLFACESGDHVNNGIYFASLNSLLARFSHRGEIRDWQMLETAQLWQWNQRSNAPQPFVTLIAQRLK